MKVIFLDFNGVLDTWQKMNVINYDNMQRLKEIVLETGAKIVITSSIKTSYVRDGYMTSILKMLVDRLTNEGIEVVGYTPIDYRRDYEIMMYLQEHPEIENYVILDDDYDMPLLAEHLIKLPSQNIGISQRGLEDEHVLKAIEILSRLPKKEDEHKLKFVPNKK